MALAKSASSRSNTGAPHPTGNPVIRQVMEPPTESPDFFAQKLNLPSPWPCL